MNLKDELFPDSNITGKTDRNNQPILEGHRLRDHNGVEVIVYKTKEGFVVTDSLEVFPSAMYVSLNSFISMSEWVEIVVPAPVKETTPVAIAPFSGEHNLAISWLDEIGTIGHIPGEAKLHLNEQHFIENMPSAEEQKRVLEGLEKLANKYPKQPSKPTRKTKRLP